MTDDDLTNAELDGLFIRDTEEVVVEIDPSDESLETIELTADDPENEEETVQFVNDAVVDRTGFNDVVDRTGEVLETIQLVQDTAGNIFTPISEAFSPLTHAVNPFNHALKMPAHAAVAKVTIIHICKRENNRTSYFCTNIL